MKVLLINKYFYYKGGAERVFFDTADLLRKKGHKVIFFSMRHPENMPSEYEKYFIGNIDYEAGNVFCKIHAAMNILYSFEARSKLARLIKAESPDVAHLHNVYHQISPSILHALKRHGVPAVLTLHDYKMCCPSYSMLAGGEVCESCKGGRYYNCFLKKCFKDSRWKSLLVTIEMMLHHHIMHIYDLADTLISPSMFLKNKMGEMGFKGKITYLPNFIDAESISPQYGAQDGSLIYFGRLSPEKGLETLIDAVKGMKGVTLKIAGDGPIEEAIKTKLAEEGISNIRLMGRMAGKDLYDEIRKSAAAVMPSEWYENNPRAVLEAFALGKPVVGSRIGGIPELVKGQETGLLFEPKDVQGLRDKIGYLLSDPGLIEKMGKNARELVVREYNAEDHYSRLIDLYKDAAGGQDGRIR